MPGRAAARKGSFVTDTTTLEPAAAAGEKPRRSGALTAMRLAELQGLASSMGISGTGKMRKGDLIDVIRAKQSGTTVGSTASASTASAPTRGARRPAGSPDSTTSDRDGAASAPVEQAPAERTERPAREAQERSGDAGQVERPEGERRERRRGRDGQNRDNRDGQSRDNQARDGQDGERDPREQQGRDGQNRESRDQQGRDRDTNRDGQGRDRDGNRDTNRDGQNRDGQGRDNQGGRQQNERQQNDRQSGQGQQNDRQGGQQGQNRYADDDEFGGRRRGRNRGRTRDKRRNVQQGGADFENEPQVAEDDVLTPCAGILDILDNYAFVRTSGYLPGPNDVYVPLGMVKRHGLRKGDAVTGAVKTPRDGEEGGQTVQTGRNQRQKYNPLVRLDTVNGMTPEQARLRPEFGKLTPLYPQERLRLETEPNLLTNRIIDLVAPIGKGQRGLIVSPPKAGKTLVLQAIANAITTNNPEAHLMVVLVDERPEEVTDMQRTVKGEVIASTFDRPADDHTTVAELAIERAKRLVELGHDVVVLLDSITRLGRAYNQAAPASGRIMSGGVDSSALYPPKRFFGAARNIENGGSLTILATALVETGSKMDEVIFEEFKGTGNMELRLSRQLADRRIFPAVDVNPSGTRREEILLAPEELKIMWKLRRVLSALDAQQSIELLLDRLKKTRSNYEFLVQVQQTSNIRLDDEDQA